MCGQCVDVQAKMVRLLILSICALFALNNGFKIQPRIINGGISRPEDFPFFVQLIDESGLCGGTLISDRWILTAAQCIMDKTEISAYFGINAAGGFNTQITIPASNQYIYSSGFNATVRSNDIGLIELPVPVALNEFIRPAKLTDHCEAPHMGLEGVIAAGVGRVVRGQPINERRLRQAHFLTMDSEECANLHGDWINPNSIICAYVHTESQASIAAGDSGGPLVWSGTGDLVGVSSSIVSNGHVQVFTNVPFYYQWIARTTHLNLPRCNDLPAYLD